MHLTQTGKGPDLVLLHGWGFNGLIWQQLSRSLIDDWRVTIPDLPGHGESCDWPDGKKLDTDAIVAQLAMRLPDQSNVVGWSWGGQLAWQLARAYPHKVKRMLLVATTPCFLQRPDWPLALQASAWSDLSRRLQRDVQRTLTQFLRWQLPSAEWQERIQPLLFQKGLAPVNRLQSALDLLKSTDFRADLSAMPCPVHWVFGAQDVLVPVGVADWLRQVQPEAACTVLPEAGHLPFITHELEFLRLMLRFLHKT
jgi:pimeloyl-[acyl-carrier protein] methyl ester esterase